MAWKDYFINVCFPIKIFRFDISFCDIFGNLTVYTPLGSNVVDYCAVSPELISKIRHFNLNPFEVESCNEKAVKSKSNMTFYGIEAQQSNNTRNRIHLGIEHEFD